MPLTQKATHLTPKSPTDLFPLQSSPLDARCVQPLAPLSGPNPLISLLRAPFSDAKEFDSVKLLQASVPLSVTYTGFRM